MGWHSLHGPLVQARSQGMQSHSMSLKSIRLDYTKTNQRSVAQG
jgi:hypothetical protein